MLIHDLFERDVTRAIPPVVYFHEQQPEELEREVSEYIVTGGYKKDDTRATDDGIHEELVRLLTGMRSELARWASGHRLPACWISGFYGSGKSSLAKLLGLALDGRKLPGGRPLAEALLARDTSPKGDDLRRAWAELVGALKAAPLAVVFDVGSKARDDEHVHAVIVRMTQERLGYATLSQLVAEYELKLENEGLYGAFIDKVAEVHARPWSELQKSQLVEDYFSAVMHALKPELYPEPTSFVDARSGTEVGLKRSADDAVRTIAEMMKHRAPGRALFIVIDEVSQYVHDDNNRMLALQSFVSALGQRMNGEAWLLATGQQKLEDGAGATAIVKLKDRFPPGLRVHLGPANIRDVVHKRLLKKQRPAESVLRELFEEHRADLRNYGYKPDSFSVDDFVEVYPLLPGYVELLLGITTGLRTRSTRVQGDSHAIRGLLQLLGDLFRHDGEKLTRMEVGRLITIDLVFDILASALDADLQMTLAAAFDFCGKRGEDRALLERVLKAVAMLEHVQDKEKTTPELIARCLYARLGEGDLTPAVEKALDVLRGESFLSYSEQTGYRVESSAGQEWQREREAYAATAEQRSRRLQEVLATLLGDVAPPKLGALSLPWLALFSDGLSAREVHIKDERKHTVVTIDFQAGRPDEATQWVSRSDSDSHRDRIVWVIGEVDVLRHAANEVERSARMVALYEPRQAQLSSDKARFLVEERNKLDAHKRELSDALQAAFMAGTLYFRGRSSAPRQHRQTFKEALAAFAQGVLPELYPHPTTVAVPEKDILFLIENSELAAPPPALGQDQLGILSLDAGRYAVTCSGRVPSALLSYIKQHGGVQGSTLLAHFGGPPHGVLPDVVRACVVGLLRAGKLRVDLPGIGELTSVRDEGARELLKDAGLKKASLTVNEAEIIKPADRNAICALFKDHFHKDVPRDNDAIADAVAERFAGVRERLNEIGERFRRLPGVVAYPKGLEKLASALERCRRDRKVEPTVKATKHALSDLRDGLSLLSRMETDLSDATIELLGDAEAVRTIVWPSLQAVGTDEETRAAAQRLEAHFKVDRPWEDAHSLKADVGLVREAYRARRGAVLQQHGRWVEQAEDSLRRRPGYEKLAAEQRHLVLRHLRDAADPRTDERAVAPPLEGLEATLAARREAGLVKAQRQLDELLEAAGATPVVEVDLSLAGREIETEAELDRLLEELKRKIIHQLAAHHRVRLR
ncbi:MAG: BREX system P-loop protein BrxC [Polyangiaceae bacterium]|nr:BREX system P-loop protein BrxC [Polyangiaceae bacterium]